MRRRHGIMAMAAQLHMEPALIACLCKSFKDRREIDFTVAKHEVFMHSLAHVLYVDIGDAITE